MAGEILRVTFADIECEMIILTPSDKTVTKGEKIVIKLATFERGQDSVLIGIFPDS